MDVSEKIKALLALENSPCYMVWKNKNLVYLDANDKFLKLVKLTKSELFGKTDYELPWQGKADEVKKQDLFVLKRNNIANLTDSRCLANESKLFLINKFPIIDQDDQVSGILTIAQIIVENNNSEDFKEVLYINPNMSKTIHTENRDLHTVLKQITNDAFSAREIDCLSLWLHGYSIRESSNCLRLSNKTVEAYRKNIKEKIGISHKHQLMDLMFTKGLLNYFLTAAKNIMKKYKEKRGFLQLKPETLKIENILRN